LSVPRAQRSAKNFLVADKAIFSYHRRHKPLLVFNS